MSGTREGACGATGEASVQERPRAPQRKAPAEPVAPEIGGPKGPEPTRYGDWEKAGRCIDF